MVIFRLSVSKSPRPYFLSWCNYGAYTNVFQPQKKEMLPTEQRTLCLNSSDLYQSIKIKRLYTNKRLDAFTLVYSVC